MAVRQGMLPNSTEFKKFVVKIMYQTSKLNFNYLGMK